MQLKCQINLTKFDKKD